MILIDCPPALGLLTINGLVAADWALVSSEAQYFALQGVNGALEVIEQAREYYNADLEFLGVLMNIADMRTTHSRDAYAQLEEDFGDKVFETVIRVLDRLRRVGREGALDPRLPARISARTTSRWPTRCWRASGAKTLVRVADAPRLTLGMGIRVFHCDDSEAFTRLVAFWLAEHDDIEHVGQAHTAEARARRAAGGAGRRRPARHARQARRRRAAAGDPRRRARREGDRLLRLRAADAGGRARRRGRRLPREGRRRRRRCSTRSARVVKPKIS